MDVWVFAAEAGDNITLRISEVIDNGGFTPWIRLYGPDGVLLGTRSGAAQAEISFHAQESCLYELLVSDGSSSRGATGSYTLTALGLPEQGKQLRIRKTGPAAVKICWPSELAGYVLQQNDTLDATGWLDVSVSPSDNGLNASLALPVEAGNRFFRLRPPTP